MNRRDFIRGTGEVAVAAAVAGTLPITASALEPVPIMGTLIQPVELSSVYRVEWLAYQVTWSCKWSNDGISYNRLTQVTRLMEYADRLEAAVWKSYDDDAKRAIREAIRGGGR